MIAQQATAAFTPLLTLDTASAYNANAMQYHPMSTSKRKLEEGDPIVDHHGNQQANAQNTFSAKQLMNIANAKRLGFVGTDERILDDYINAKKAIQAQGIKNPTEHQVDSVYLHMKAQKEKNQLAQLYVPGRDGAATSTLETAPAGSSSSSQLFGASDSGAASSSSYQADMQAFIDSKRDKYQQSAEYVHQQQQASQAQRNQRNQAKIEQFNQNQANRLQLGVNQRPSANEPATQPTD